MEMHLLGKTGEKVSLLGLGGYHLLETSTPRLLVRFDELLEKVPELKGRIRESHPEGCFAVAAAGLIA